MDRCKVRDWINLVSSGAAVDIDQSGGTVATCVWKLDWIVGANVRTWNNAHPRLVAEHRRVLDHLTQNRCDGRTGRHTVLCGFEESEGRCEGVMGGQTLTIGRILSTKSFPHKCPEKRDDTWFAVNTIGLPMKLIHVFVFTALVFTSELTLAQQTIINVPSDALTPQGSHFVLHESQFSPRSKKATYTTTNFYTYGLTDNTELAATLYSVDNDGSELGALGLGWKSTYEVFQEEMPELKVKWTSGFMLPISVEETRGQVG